MKRKILLTVAVILTVMLSACGMSEEEIGMALSNINNEYQSGTYEQAQTEIVKLEKVTKKMTDEQKSKYDELKPLIEYAVQSSGEINNALNDAQSLCDQKMYYEANQALDKISTDYKLPPTEQKKFDEEKTTAENGIKSVKITDALKNVETIYNGGDYDKATEELSKIDTSNLTDAQSQKYQSLQTNITNAKAAAEKAEKEKKEKEAKYAKYIGTYTCTPSGESRPLIGLDITEANSDYIVASAYRLRGKGYEYTIGKANMTSEYTAETNGSFGFEGKSVSKKYVFSLNGSYVVMNVYNTSGSLEDSYTFYKN